MPDTDMNVVAITSEAAAWDTLEQVLSGQLSTENLVLDFSGSEWAQFRVDVKGDPFHQTVTPSIMRGLVDLQSSFYRSIALIVRGEADARRLTDIEKADFELIFKVDDGSSEIWAQLEPILKEVAGKVADKMTQRGIIILLLGLAVVYGSHSLGTTYFNNAHQEKLTEIQGKLEAERAKAASDGETARMKVIAEKDTKTIDALSKMAETNADTERKQRILSDAGHATDGINIILNEGLNSYDAIVRQATRADSIVVQGKSIDKSVVQIIRKTSRRNSKDVNVKERVYIRAIDRIEDHHYQYRLEVVDDGRTIVAEISDQVLQAKYGRVLRERLGDGKPILLEIKGRQIGDDLLDAEIFKMRVERKRAGAASSG
jgi:triphosphoribosyl-dephospho-CoA synthetase